MYPIDGIKRLGTPIPFTHFFERKWLSCRRRWNGDAGGALAGLYIINEARRLCVPPAKRVQMLGNVAVDSVLGSVPLAGDVFDVFFKSHRRNLQLILDHFGIHPDELRKG